MAKKGKGHENGNGADQPTDDAKVMEQKVRRDMNFKLSADEKNKMADNAAELSQERDALVADLKLYQSLKRGEIKERQQEIDRLLKCHKNGTETREVDVTERLDWEQKTVTYFHNGEQIEQREMHDAELQMKLDTNESRKIVKDKRTRTQKNPDKNLTPEELEKKDIADVHKLETRRKTKRSAVDEVHPG